MAVAVPCCSEREPNENDRDEDGFPLLLDGDFGISFRDDAVLK